MGLNLRREVASAKGQSIVHDLRGPLAALKAIASKSGQLGRDQEVLFLVVDRIEGITKSLLSMDESIAWGTSSEGVFGGISIESLIRSVQNLIREKRVQFRNGPKVQIQIILEESLKPLIEGNQRLKPPCDLPEVQRALSNVMDNSVESLLEGGFVSIQVRAKLGHIILSVVDSGPGILPELLRRLGYQKVPSIKAGGNGLGLFFARKMIVACCGGRLKIRSKLGAGTSVSIVLPIQKEI